ncbi:transposase [Aeromicrobium sp. YIM 150415]|nr:transposase [Aeromicrobium sp. YIM 150415]
MARCEGVGKESVRRWVVQAQIDGGQCQGATSEELGIRPSIGAVADAYDNALMESAIGLFKTECIRTTIFHPAPYRTLGDVEYATAGWVDWWNNRRLHSSLGMMTPAEYEAAHYATLNREPQTV